MGAKKINEKKLLNNVKLHNQSLPAGYDGQGLKNALHKTLHHAEVKSTRAGSNYMRVYEAAKAGASVEHIISVAHTCMMESRISDYYKQVSIAAQNLSNYNWMTDPVLESNRTPIWKSAAMVCFAANSEDPNTFPDCLNAAYYLYMILPEDFKQMLVESPQKLLDQTFMDKKFKPPTLKQIIMYIEAILNQYNMKFEASAELMDQLNAQEPERPATAASSMPPAQSQRAPLPALDEMSQAQSTMMPVQRAVPQSDEASIATFAAPAAVAAPAAPMTKAQQVSGLNLPIGIEQLMLKIRDESKHI